jgi:hypothetical protein
VQGDELIASYYTSPPERDITWVLGMFGPTHIRMRASICRRSNASPPRRAPANARSSWHERDTDAR